MQALIPILPHQLGGPFVTADQSRFEIRANRGRTVIICFHSVPQEISWFKDFEFMFCQAQHDPDMVKVIRTATSNELRQLRVPIWIQGDEIPECCGRPMHFIGQIDDDRLCTERPPDAKLWWHDVASFYVFTCDQCLECKAVGQQF